MKNSYKVRKPKLVPNQIETKSYLQDPNEEIIPARSLEGDTINISVNRI